MPRARMSQPPAALDLHAELERLASLPRLAGRGSRLRRRLPALAVVWSDDWHPICGLADEDFRVTLVLTPWFDEAEVRQTLLHELVHLSWPECWAHRAPFKRTLIEAAEEAFGVWVGDEVGVRSRVTDIDLAITTAMRTVDGAPPVRALWPRFRELAMEVLHGR